MKYRAQWNFRSGPWQFGEGAEVDLSEADAAHINAKSPGVLVPLSVTPDQEGGQEPGAGQRQVKAARNRAVTKAGGDR